MIPKLRNIIKLLSNKVDKVTGKDLSTNDFTDTYKTKLDGIATGATNNTVIDNLESQSSTDALSANQGRILNKKITNATTYSTEEINTGKKWVDGRDIYSKTFFFTMPNDNFLQMGTDISNFDRLIDLKSTWRDTVDTKWFSNVRFDTSTVYIKFGVSKSFIWVEGKGTDWASRTSDACITIEYVKVEE